MKGISTILAMILIVIIVVALIGLTYTFAVGLFTTTTTGATQQTAAITERMQKSVAIVASSCQISGSTTTYYFTLKNTGTLNIASDELKSFVDGTQITVVTFNNINAGDVDTELTFDNETGPQGTTGSHILRISAPAGEIDTSISCS